MARMDWDKANRRRRHNVHGTESETSLPKSPSKLMKLAREKYPHLAKPTNEKLPPRLTKNGKRKRSERKKK